MCCVVDDGKVLDVVVVVADCGGVDFVVDVVVESDTDDIVVESDTDDIVVGSDTDDIVVEADTDDIVVEAASFDVEEDVSVVVGDNFVVAGKVVGANDDDSISFPASVSVVEADNEIVKSVIIGALF